jgi:hypothetical protein
MGTETESLAKAANTYAVLTSKSEGMVKEVKELQGQLAELNIILDKVGRTRRTRCLRRSGRTLARGGRASPTHVGPHPDHPAGVADKQRQVGTDAPPEELEQQRMVLAQANEVERKKVDQVFTERNGWDTKTRDIEEQVRGRCWPGTVVHARG